VSAMGIGTEKKVTKKWTKRSSSPMARGKGKRNQLVRKIRAGGGNWEVKKEREDVEKIRHAIIMCRGNCVNQQKKSPKRKGTCLQRRKKNRGGIM